MMAANLPGLIEGLIGVSLALSLLGVARVWRWRRVIPERRLQRAAGRSVSSSRIGAESAGWLTRRLAGRRLEPQLQAAGLSWGSAAFLRCMVASGMGTAFLGWFISGHAVVGLLIGVAGGLAPLAWLRVRRQRRLSAFERQFPDALDMMVNALRSGLPLPAAMSVVAAEAPEPIATEFSVLLQQEKLGIDLRHALDDLRARIDLVDVHLFSTGLIVQRETGGNLTEIFDGLAAVIRDRFRILGDTRTLTAEGRMSGVILGLLPVALVLALAQMAPEHLRFFTETAIGKMMLVSAGLLELLGFWLLRRIGQVKL